uniref:Reverse transcriptase domain-containing protein n=1 Tax=Steinernema glaseri TaxID=37863 RepID=A0A1I8AN66_9BILA
MARTFLYGNLVETLFADESDDLLVSGQFLADVLSTDVSVLHRRKVFGLRFLNPSDTLLRACLREAVRRLPLDAIRGVGEELYDLPVDCVRQPSFCAHLDQCAPLFFCQPGQVFFQEEFQDGSVAM